jgi:ferric-dicitrate binding protein FerR (iron transport regulator)
VLLVVAGFYLLLKMLVSGPDKVIFASNDKLLEQQLPDGSMISLNAHSTISYPEEFSGNTREINLTGEAFFSVVHRVEKPFIVYAGDMQIEVLGTEFNVNANEKSDSITVYVESGKVKFHPNGKETDSNLLLYLEAGDKGVYLKSSGKLSKAEKPDAYELFWLNKTLRFEETEVSKVIELLRKIYNVDIKTDNKEIQNCLLTATFHDDPIDIVLNVIAESFDLSVTMEDNTYTLHGEGCR